eukprot:38261-Eustigmatos_ZCMA.PRE.1
MSSLTRARLPPCTGPCAAGVIFLFGQVRVGGERTLCSPGTVSNRSSTQGCTHPAAYARQDKDITFIRASTCTQGIYVDSTTSKK